MAAPLVTVTEDTDVAQIARLLAIHFIKRVPVLHDGRIVGIVSRADLLRMVAAKQPQAETGDSPKHRGFLLNLFGDYHRPAWEVIPVGHPAEATTNQKRDEGRVGADDFRHLVEDFHHGEAQHRDETRRAAAEQRQRRARELIDTHVFDAGWREMLHSARRAAENGQTEYLMLSFPSQLCIDGGRAINVAESDWPRTLRGEAAELYLRWERELKPQGFSLSAHVLDFPDGKPGSCGLFLTWRD
jgi:hypothetical protein